MRVGHVISKLRYDNKMTQEELADKIGKTKGSVGMYETDKRKPDYDTLIKIADIFNVSTDYLLSHSVNESNIVTKVNNSLDYKEHSKQGLYILELYESMNEEGKAILYGKARELIREQRLEEKRNDSHVPLAT